VRARRVVVVAIGLVAAITVVIIGMPGRGAIRHEPSRTASHGELASVDRVAIQRVASQFAVAASDHQPAQQAAAQWRSATDLVTPDFGLRLANQAPVVTAAEAGTTQRLKVVSVAVRLGGPVKAMVLGTLSVERPGQWTVRAPVTWILTILDTAGGWRIAGATS
jgi:hypothetical protein